MSSLTGVAEIKSIILKLFLILIVLFFVGFIIGMQPSRASVENFLLENSCVASATETGYSAEYECAQYLRRHTTVWGGQILRIPEFTFLFIFTPFHYFNYIEPGNTAYDQHTYIFVITADEGSLVYNPVNGKYIGRFDDLLRDMNAPS